ncbi:hypothetical protein MBLNU230_g1246t1 [Neophaeotheca triangularis]
MADVMGIPRRVDGQSYYESQSTSGLIRSSPSSSNLFAAGATSPPSSSSASSSPKHSETAGSEQQDSIHDSPLSTTPSSPPESAFDFAEPFFRSSTPASGAVSLEHKYASDDEPDFADFDKTQFTTQHIESTTPAQNQSSGAEQVPSTASATESTISDSPLPTPAVADDTAIKIEPSRHVDYLSHDWKEEDIWSSWRHIVSQRRVYGQRSRLENASWRTWAKSKYKLATVSPETLNWLKESDVTWLYGPLKPSSYSHGTSEPTSRLSKSNSFVNPKKPILKKRTMSEVMLQKSISTSSLVQQAATSAQAQNRQRRLSHNDLFNDNYPSESPSREPTDYFSSSRSESSNGAITPCDCQPRRHIRFDDTVEQCIAVDGKPEDDDDSSSESEDDNCLRRRNSSSSSSSDDGVVMMKRRRRPNLSKCHSNDTRTSRDSSLTNTGGKKKIIEPLPNTTLKYRTDSPDNNSQQQPPQPFGRSWGAGRLSPSPSQETLKPTRPSRNFLLDDDDSDPNEENSAWSFGASNPKSALGGSNSSSSSVLDEDSEIPPDAAETRSKARSMGYGPREYGAGAGGSGSGSGEFGAGMRRTNSGMFMPYEEDEDDEVAAGLFGRVSDTINTARDIAHVIWNVGWRK